MLICFGCLAANAQDAAKRKLKHLSDSVHAAEAAANKREVDSLIATQNAAAKASERQMERKYGKAAIAKVNKGQVWVGMTDELCLYGLTAPNATRTTYTKSGKAETWVYEGQAAGCVGDGCPYLDYVITFKNHRAIAISTSN